MEDFNLRQLWPLTNIVMKVKKECSNPNGFKGMNYNPDELLKTKGQNKKDVRNEGCSG
jgi:hypothetical protein